MKKKWKTSLFFVVEKYQKTTTKKTVLLVEPHFEMGVKIDTKCDLQKNDNSVKFSSS